jgi:hypothetical protein
VHPLVDKQLEHLDLHTKQPVVDVREGVPLYPLLQIQTEPDCSAFGSSQDTQSAFEVHEEHPALHSTQLVVVVEDGVP